MAERRNGSELDQQSERSKSLGQERQSGSQQEQQQDLQQPQIDQVGNSRTGNELDPSEGLQRERTQESLRGE